MYNYNDQIGHDNYKVYKMSIIIASKIGKKKKLEQKLDIKIKIKLKDKILLKFFYVALQYLKCLISFFLKYKENEFKNFMIL